MPTSKPAPPVSADAQGLAYSVVVPFFNEEIAVGSLLEEIQRAMVAVTSDYEVIAVDDGSTDATMSILRAVSAKDQRIRILQQPVNQGQAAALFAGLHAARGEVVITMDGDGQNDPADIPRLLPLLEEADMVVGIRSKRRDSWLRRAMSRFANRFRARILRDGMRDSGCALKAFRREVVSSFIPIRTLYSFMPALAVGAGFRLAQTEVAHRARDGGVSSYGLRAFLWRPLLDLLGIWWFTRRSFLNRPGSITQPAVELAHDQQPAPHSEPDDGPVTLAFPKPGREQSPS